MMSFASFTGVNHHRQFFLFGCLLLVDETDEEGYFCEHILRIMQERHLTVIPEQYMLKRWTIGARYIMNSGVSTIKENENTVTPIMEWSFTALATKAAHKASSSIATYNEYRSWLNGFMVSLMSCV
ncbi:hypothetical protein CFOL_v3_27961 [Cephalotus follicularis]|uniref:Uncharacterized protein n=1 Tax=Cephalotus follicularis TaxID=3775 RepID=A0A1Q3CWC1_CEPFO|nr:hypothetical protein CFOL_v3_27961 [Cephalotus follicularis]